ncbi:MAG TPA: SDR family oxidoreductase [Planctomycetes bacterium]|nr:SDR family oxidoreductase [Planctomycetota bacterium]HIL37840.1 SDR family oxidoreductase [Planctomycetota bacterium]
MVGPAAGRYPHAMQQPRVVLTGASGGIGLAFCQALGQRGARVWVCGRDEGRLGSAKAAVEQAGGSATSLVMDLEHPDSLRVAVEQLSQEAPIDWLVNNAGIVETAPVHSSKASGEQARRLMQVNFHAARELTQGLLGLLAESKRPSVVMVASSAALGGHPYVAAYSASKHALLGWARCAARDLQTKGIAVNVVCPHFVDTPMTDSGADFVAAKTGRSREQVKAEYAAINPSGVLIAPSEVALAALGLLESTISGHVLELTGGDSQRCVDQGFEIEAITRRDQ